MGQMVIATALLRLNDLGRSVTPTFPETDSSYNNLHIVQNGQYNQCSKLKFFKISVHGTSNPAILRLQRA